MTVFVSVPPSLPLSKTMRLCVAMVVFDDELDENGAQLMRAGALSVEGLPEEMNEVQKPIAS